MNFGFDAGNLQQGEGELRYVVPILEIGVKVRQSGDFGVEHQWLGLPIEREVSTTAVAVEVRLLHPLDLHLADGAAYPLGGIGLRRSEEDLSGGLREHDLGQVPIDDFQLGLALETQNEWVAGLAILGDGGVQLWQLLQAGQLVDDKPHRMLLGLGRAEQPQNEHIDPKTVQRTERFAFGGLRSNEDPSLSIL